MDGCEFRKRQRNDPRLAPIPVVLVSAVNDIEPKRVELGRITFLRKPIDIDELARVLREAITDRAEVPVVSMKRGANSQEPPPSVDARRL